MVVLEMLRGHVPPVAVLMVMLLLHNTKHKPEAGLRAPLEQLDHRQASNDFVELFSGTAQASAKLREA